jgi:hypothetical protein
MAGEARERFDCGSVAMALEHVRRDGVLVDDGVEGRRVVDVLQPAVKANERLRGMLHAVSKLPRAAGGLRHPIAEIGEARALHG